MLDGPVGCFSYPTGAALLSRDVEEEGNALSRLFTSEEDREMVGEEMELGKLEDRKSVV